MKKRKKLRFVAVVISVRLLTYWVFAGEDKEGIPGC